MEGTPFGRYRLIEMLGRGGMGEVWRAWDVETKRTVAIKVLAPYLADDNEFVQRFRREAEAAAQLNSPHVIPIHHYGEIDGRLYVDMRLIDGRDLGTLLTEGPLEPARAVRIIEQVAKALHAAHKAGLIHRDIKPSNILLDDDDFAYLIDFGIARAADETRMTKSGNTIGTFAYIAPERLDPQTEEDARADIYSLACVLYEALTGKPPFPGSTAAHLIAAHLNTPPPRPSAIQPDVPQLVDEVIATGMAKDPNQRYATTIELADAARGAITEPISRPKPTPATQPATEPAPVPTAPRTVAAQDDTAPPDASKASAPIRRPLEEMPTYRPKPSAERPPTPSPRPWWQRKAILLSAASIVPVGAIVLVITLATTGNHPASQTSQIGQPSRNSESPPMGTASATPTFSPTFAPQPTPLPSPTAAPPPPSTPSTSSSTTVAPPSTSLPPAGGAAGFPCNASNAARIGYDPNTGEEVVCVNQGLIGGPTNPPSWQWAAPPPMTAGAHETGTSCDVRVGNMSRSTDGYLISCKPIQRGDPYGGYWQHYLGPIE